MWYWDMTDEDWEDLKDLTRELSESVEEKIDREFASMGIGYKNTTPNIKCTVNKSPAYMPSREVSEDFVNNIMGSLD